jgi:hypothetical protein
MELAPSPAGQSALMPMNFTTLAHFSVSSAMSLPKSAGEPASAGLPRSASCALTFDIERQAAHELKSVATFLRQALLEKVLRDIDNEGEAEIAVRQHRRAPAAHRGARHRRVDHLVG